MVEVNVWVTIVVPVLDSSMAVEVKVAAEVNVAVENEVKVA